MPLARLWSRFQIGYWRFLPSQRITSNSSLTASLSRAAIALNTLKVEAGE